MNGALLVYQISVKIVNSLNLVKNAYIKHYIVPNKCKKRIFNKKLNPEKELLNMPFILTFHVV